jgi:hypothetical protein
VLSHGAAPSPPRRTVAEAIAQADAKERIRTARNVRRTGLTLFGFAVLFLVNPRRSLLYSLIVTVRPPGGRSFLLPLPVILGGLAGVLSPFVLATGQWMLRRATNAARNDPITAPVLDQRKYRS